MSTTIQFVDKSLTCRDCEKTFLWTAGEQAFFHDRGLENVPVRCPECRAKRRQKQGLISHAVVEVSCAKCGQQTTVPFVPRNGKPIYCSTCLADVRAEEAEPEAAP